jgi:hypothetical protein
VVAAKQDDTNPQAKRQIVIRSEGVTPSEKYLKKLCDRSFLSLWSYPGIFRDQGRRSGKGDGKEVADLLVVFENNVIIFSDKHIHFEKTERIEVGWGRWFRNAVLKSAQQVWGAERWIRQFPKRLFLDKGCTVPFPIDVPDPARATFHRVVVAHDASRVCREYFGGGSGSLILDSGVIGEDAHLKHPFVIGRVRSDRGYVHVFDDTSLDVVMSYLDTVSDFVAYLTKKEKLLTSGLHVRAAGEEELLGEYVKRLNSEGDHDFIIPKGTTHVFLAEGLWEKFLNSDQRKAQAMANEISYRWDLLVEKFLHHMMSGTQYASSHREISEQEKSFRWLARENRTRRRMLANDLLGLLKKTPADFRASRVVLPSRPGDPYYLFLLLPYYPSLKEREYRDARGYLLESYLMVVKLHYPDAQHIVGIATETLAREDYRSEDCLYLDATDWNTNLEQQARDRKTDLGIFVNVKTYAGREQEYPTDKKKLMRTVVSRNSPCTCGSGKRYKRCCGQGMHSKKKGKIFRKKVDP